MIRGGPSARRFFSAAGEASNERDESTSCSGDGCGCARCAARCRGVLEGGRGRAVRRSRGSRAGRASAGRLDATGRRRRDDGARQTSTRRLPSALRASARHRAHHQSGEPRRSRGGGATRGPRGNRHAHRAELADGPGRYCVLGRARLAEGTRAATRFVRRPRAGGARSPRGKSRSEALAPAGRHHRLESLAPTVARRELCASRRSCVISRASFPGTFVSG